MMRPGILIVMLCAACRPGLVEERRADLQMLCEDYCPRRVDCVDDGWAKHDVEACTRMCEDEERYLLDNACGTAAYALLECMAALTCEELPLAVDGLASNGRTAGCYDEQVEQRERCTFEIVR